MSMQCLKRFFAGMCAYCGTNIMPSWWNNKQFQTCDSHMISVLVLQLALAGGTSSGLIAVTIAFSPRAVQH